MVTFMGENLYLCESRREGQMNRTWYEPNPGWAERTEALQIAYSKMSPEERAPIDRLIKKMTNSGVKALGEGTAMEVLGKLGMWMEERA
jgi:hypothetical protein